MINFSPKTDLAPNRGKLLLSEPFLKDPYFKRTVVLLCEHNEQGSYGFILNRYVDLDLDEVIDEFPSLDTRIGHGGPVQDSRLFYLHRLGDAIEGSIEVSKDIYIGGNFDIIKKLILSKELKKTDIRFFIGYSGWDKDQLEEELNEHTWLVADSDNIDLMDTSNEKLWEYILKSMGRDYANLAHFPEDPSFN